MRESKVEVDEGRLEIAINWGLFSFGVPGDSRDNQLSAIFDI